MAKNATKKHECTQCGSTRFEREGEAFLRCSYCQSLYELAGKKSKGPAVVIRKGANVVIGKNADVVVRGGLEIESGANVQMLGKLTLVERGSDEMIQQARLRLKGEG